MDFKFVSHELFSEKQNILLQHMHKKVFWILTNKCGNNLKHENKAEEPWLFSLIFVFKNISTFIGENPKFFLCMCLFTARSIDFWNSFWSFCYQPIGMQKTCTKRDFCKLPEVSLICIMRTLFSNIYCNKKALKEQSGG